MKNTCCQSVAVSPILKKYPELHKETKGKSLTLKRKKFTDYFLPNQTLCL